MIGMQDTHNHPHRGCLAGSIRANKAMNRRLGNSNREIVHGPHAAENLRHLIDLDCVHRIVARPSRSVGTHPSLAVFAGRSFRPACSVRDNLQAHTGGRKAMATSAAAQTPSDRGDAQWPSGPRRNPCIERDARERDGRISSLHRQQIEVTARRGSPSTSATSWHVHAIVAPSTDSRR